MLQITFLMDETLLSKTGNGDLPERLRAEGFNVMAEPQDSALCRMEPYESAIHGPSVIYGSIPFVTRRQSADLVPGAYYHATRFNCSYYQNRLPLDLLGNGEGIYLPFGDFERRAESIYRLFGVSRLFIRPDAGSKSFTGVSISLDDLNYELNSLRRLTSVTNDTLVLISPHQEVTNEYRFYIVNGKVITASSYRINGEDVDDAPIDVDCMEVASRIAESSWQIDLAYTCDVGLFDGKPKVVELNAFSTSGLYRCDAVALFKAVAEVALREYEGELSLMD